MGSIASKVSLHANLEIGRAASSLDQWDESGDPTENRDTMRDIGVDMLCCRELPAPASREGYLDSNKRPTWYPSTQSNHGEGTRAHISSHSRLKAD